MRARFHVVQKRLTRRTASGVGGILAIALIARSAATQAPAAAPHDSTASIAGDAFLTFENGDVRRIAGTPVWLVEADSATRAVARCHGADGLDSASNAATLAVIHPERSDKRSRDERMKAMNAASLASVRAKDSIVLSIRSDLVRAAVDSGSTSVDGHYTFTNVRPGRYAVFSEATIGSSVYAWLVPMTAASGATTRDLNNANLGGAYCGFTVFTWTFMRHASAAP